MPIDAGTETAGEIRISAKAAGRIATLVANEGDPALMFRIAVSGGGCSGFQYGFSLDDQCRDDDRVFENGGVRVIVDEMSLELIRGSEIDYVDELIGAYFAVKNPNATATCGCGSSFSV
ncbi:putative chaperone involved in Fe-S cluster assembly and activation; hesB-like [Candidatus Defluviicoccus seviourii]|uniref:Chaperone involved in Fe-S cluster assembly and activation hesB-like n=2 Tax=root TaxID=1 RepID=A0A564WAP3_9PROT|nr:putative chaperone involved in Fe-S cluster assembly and activation; hesB-like [uncultured Defluviicoccus sp.]VUX45532.1 putative chaperone involved in Fe-S cluster assembly and activation; hesB-like [Candidatus Defluviicoccus seviourii]